MSSYFDKSKETERWMEERRGKFTSSELFKLREQGQGTLFGKGAMTYIESKAVQMITRTWQRESAMEAEPLLHGKMYEYVAYKRYIEATGNNEMEYFGEDNPLFLDYEPLKDDCGGSPDGGVIDDKYSVSLGLEIKCPFDPINHFRRLDWKDQYDLKENYILCYTQIQSLLMFSGAPLWHFVSFDERMLWKSKQIKIIDVKPDINFQNNLLIRIKMAIKEKYVLLSRVLDCSVTNKSELSAHLQS